MTPPESYTRQFSLVLAHLNKGEIEAAAAACDQLPAEDAAVCQVRATIALRSGAVAEAQAAIERSLALRPGHAPSLLLKAKILIAAGRPTEAMAVLTSVGAVDAGMWQELGVALQKAGQEAPALQAFTRASVAAPGLAPAHFARGVILHRRGAVAEALQALRRATALDPAHATAQFALGLVCQDDNDEGSAAEAFAAALRHRPDFAEAAVNLGIALQRLGRMDEALDAYRQAVHLRPDTLSRIAQAITAANTGFLPLTPSALRRKLGA